MAISDIRPSEIVTDEGGQYNFTGGNPPQGPSAKTNIDIGSVDMDCNPYDIDGKDSPQQVHDTYVGIPGDGIVPG